MTIVEQCLQFECGGETLVGVLSLPDSQAQTCVLIVVGGPQYRAGSHRMFVLLARQLAAAGIAAMRFDVRGMGDSTGTFTSFEGLTEDIHAAIAAVVDAMPSLRQIVLWGLCDGASASMMYLARKTCPLVTGLCLLNPWIRSPDSQARTRVKHYYVRRLTDRDFWRKLVSGQVAARAIMELFNNLMQARVRQEHGPTSFQEVMRVGLDSFEHAVLIMLSGRDYTAREFVDFTRANQHWTALLSRAAVVVQELSDADHTLSNPNHLIDVSRLTASWVEMTQIAAASRDGRCRHISRTEESSV